MKKLKPPYTVFVVRIALEDSTMTLYQWWLTDPTFTPQQIVDMLEEGTAQVEWDFERGRREETVILVDGKEVAVLCDTYGSEQYRLESVEQQDKKPRTESQAAAEDWRKYGGPKTAEEFRERMERVFGPGGHLDTPTDIAPA